MMLVVFKFSSWFVYVSVCRWLDYVLLNDIIVLFCEFNVVSKLYFNLNYLLLLIFGCNKFVCRILSCIFLKFNCLIFSGLMISGFKRLDCVNIGDWVNWFLYWWIRFWNVILVEYIKI